ncbi:MAG TPA: cellulase family glycosylhydrolase [Anaeromyxobacter sp.]|nr:cellulase family glycosylhydrolase [Anaeromyxobacter sp.]
MFLKRLTRTLVALAALTLASTASAQLKAQFKPGWIAPTDNQLALHINIVNTGSSTVALSGVTVRYYYTIDGAQSQSWWCDYTPRGCGNVTGSFGTVSPATATADTYFQIAFGSGAGSLSPGQSTGDIQLRVAKTNWANYNEANDYSYAGNTSSADNANITVSVGGTLVWGTPPSGGTQTPNFTLAASPASVSVNRGATATSTISISRTSFTDAVAFTASGLPAGVSASFNPSSSTGTSSVVTFTATSTATTGTSNVTITGAGGGLTRTVVIPLTVNTGTTTPNFTLSASPSAVTVNRSASATTTIAIARTNFTSSVAFSLSGLPGGVSASFNPGSTTGNSSVVTFTASSTATTGTFNVTVTGSGSGLIRTVVIPLTVSTGTTTPNFTLSASPTSVSVAQGSSATVSLSIARTNFTSAVAFTASTPPAGVTIGFNPTSTTANASTVTFTASATAATGTSNITITGAGGGITRTVVIALTVTPGTTTPTFTLSAAPTSLSVARGTSGTSTITITRTNFTSAVAFTSSGQPAGVTVSFNPASATGTSSVVTFAASSSATLGGPVTVTITGTGGSPVITRTVTIALTVTTGGGGFGPVWSVSGGRVTKDGVKYPVRCGSWFGLQGRYEPAYDAQNPRGAPMEQYVGNTFWAATHTRTVMQTMNEIKTAGITVIRLPVVHQTLSGTDPQGDGRYYKNYSGIINDPTYPMRNSREAMESMIKAANSVGIAVMLDIHSCSNYIDWRKGRLDARPPWVDATRDNYDFKREEWSCASTLNPPTVTNTQPYNETIWLEDLRTLAGLPARLNVTNIIGIDIFNEPHDYTWAEWKTLTEKAYQAISAVNPNLLLFVQGIGTDAGTQDGTPTTVTKVEHGDAFSNPNWGENLYPAGADLPNVPVSKLVWSPHTYGPSVFVQSMFMDPAQPQCTGLSGDAAGDARCNIVINPTLLRPGWEEHFGYLKDLGYAMVVGEFGGNMDWPRGTASTRDQNRFSYITDNTIDAKWQNAFVDYMISRGIEGCYWSINPESGDTGGWYGHAYDPISNTGGWGEWRAFDTRKTTLLNRLWSGVP